MKILCNNYLKMMLKCFLYIITILIIFSNCSKISNFSKLNMLSSSEIEQLISYLSQKKMEIKSRKNDFQAPKFIEISSNSNERGLGCEAMNKCSGQGTCKAGTCVCDEGFDYFDCSISTNTSNIK